MSEKTYFSKLPVSNHADFRDAAEIMQRIFAGIDDTDGIEDADFEGEIKLDLSIDVDE